MAKPKDVRLSHRAEKALNGLASQPRDRLKNAIRELTQDPLLGKKLKGEFEDLRSYRIGPFRIVYRFESTILEVVYIDDRKDVYR